MTKRKSIIMLVINSIIVIWMIVCMQGFFTGIGDGNMKVSGVDCFCFFTIDSNILMAAAALLMIPYNIRAIKNGTEEPGWTVIVSYIGTTAVTLTFLVVMLFLGPTQGYLKMIEGGNLYMHIIGPVLAVLSFLFLYPLFENKQKKFLLSFPKAGTYLLYEVIGAAAEVRLRPLWACLRLLTCF